MTDTTDNIILATSIENSQFQDRCRFRFLLAAYSVMTEALQCTASTTSSPPSKTLSVSGVTGTVSQLMTVSDLFNVNAIPVGAVVTAVAGSSGTAGTITLNVALTGTISAGDIINLFPVNHVSRANFALALFKGTVDPRVLAMAILANPTNRANCLANSSVPGGNILDADMDTQITATFTGLAAVGWT